MNDDFPIRKAQTSIFVWDKDNYHFPNAVKAEDSGKIEDSSEWLGKTPATPEEQYLSDHPEARRPCKATSIANVVRLKRPAEKHQK